MRFACVHDEVYATPDLGRAIRNLRRARGMTQASLAEWCAVSRQTIVSLERGGPVSVTVALKAITLLGAKVVVVPKDLVLEDPGP